LTASSPAGDLPHEVHLAVAARDPAQRDLICATLSNAISQLKSCASYGAFDELVNHWSSAERPPTVTIYDSSLCDGPPSSPDLPTATARLRELAQATSIVLLAGQGHEDLVAAAIDEGCDEAVLRDGESRYLRLLPAMVRRAARAAGARRAARSARQAAGQLRVSGETLARLFVSSPNILLITRLADGMIYEVNERWEHVTGYSRAKSVGRTTNELNLFVEEAQRERLVAMLRRDGRVRNFDLCHRTAGGSRRSMLVTAEAFDLDGEPCALATMQDVTDQRVAEARAMEHLATLAHMERLVTAGELASGLAHELNQPLSSIRMHSDLAIAVLSERGGEDLSTAISAMQVVSEQTQRAVSIIQMLRSMVRKGGMRHSSVDLHEMVRCTTSLVEPAARQQTVALSMRLWPGDITVTGDYIQLSQSLLNLLQNALDAVSQQPAARRRIEVATDVVDDEVRLAVVDFGHGMSPEVSARLFDVFFTTRDDGLGLGLAISKSIVESHRGRITGAVNEHGGATFTIALLRSDGGPRAN